MGRTLAAAKTSNPNPLVAESPGAISFAAPNFSVQEGDGSASITLTRTGGTDNRVTAKVSLADITTSAADYRFTPGAVDRSFKINSGPNNIVKSLLVQPDGKIITGGFPSANSQLPRNNLVRLNADGSQDTTFAPNITGEVRVMALQPDGKILIGGVLSTATGPPWVGILRLNSDGSVDPTFTPGGDGGVYALGMQPNGKIIVGGNFKSFN